MLGKELEKVLAQSLGAKGKPMLARLQSLSYISLLGIYILPLLDNSETNKKM